MSEWLYEGVDFLECRPPEGGSPVTLAPAYVDDEGVEHAATVLTDPPEWLTRMPEMTLVVEDGS